MSIPVLIKGVEEALLPGGKSGQVQFREGGDSARSVTVNDHDHVCITVAIRGDTGGNYFRLVSQYAGQLTFSLIRRVIFTLCVHVYSTPFTCLVPSEDTALNSLELGFGTIVSCHVGAGKQTQVLWTSSQDSCPWSDLHPDVLISM